MYRPNPHQSLSLQIRIRKITEVYGGHNGIHEGVAPNALFGVEKLLQVIECQNGVEEQPYHTEEEEFEKVLVILSDRANDILQVIGPLDDVQ